MRLSRRLAASVIASAAIVAATAGCAANSSANRPADIVIGADLASTSPTDMAYGAALQLMVDQINASHQLGDRRLALRVQDNRLDPTASLSNVSGFAADPSVVAVVMGSCGECLALSARTIDEQKLPTIALTGADLRRIPAAEQHWIFKLGPNSADDAAVLRTELARAGANRVAILYSDDAAGTDAYAALTGGTGDRSLSRAGIHVSAAEKVKAAVTDITGPAATEVITAVSKLVDSRPDALVVLTGPDQADAAAVAARNAHFDGRLLLDATAAGDLFLSHAASPALAEARLVFTKSLGIDDAVATNPAKSAQRQWMLDFTGQEGDFNGSTLLAGDAATLIGRAVAGSGNDRAAVRDKIETAQIDGLSGPIRFTAGKHSGLQPQALTVLIARGGRWRLPATATRG